MNNSGQPGWLDIPTIRDRINAIDRLMLQMLSERAYLVQEVGKIKHAEGKSLQASDREAAMFDRMEKECKQLGLNFDYVSELWSTMIYYAKVMECDAVGIDSFLDKQDIAPAVLRKNLLALTELTAPTYNDYCRGAGTDAIRSYRDREDHLVRRVIGNGLPDRALALDLGCATGQMTELLENSFDVVRGYDVSSHMCQEAQKRRTWKQCVVFEQTDLELGIPASTGSVALVIANFGCASEFGCNFLAELKRVLVKGGKAVLSFYNKNALLNYWFYPWPSTVKARLNRHNGTLEVWTGGSVYTVQAKGWIPKELQLELKANGFELVGDVFETYPTMQAIVPRFFFTSKRADSPIMIEIAREIDLHLARSKSGVNRGTYILMEVQKK